MKARQIRRRIREIPWRGAMTQQAVTLASAPGPREIACASLSFAGPRSLRVKRACRR